MQNKDQAFMKAALCTAYGAPEVLQVTAIPRPVPGDRQILVQVLASTVNSGDVRVRGLIGQGWMRLLMRLMIGFRKPRKPVLGTVFAGRVVATGKNVQLYKPGDEVFGMTGFGFGCHAEYLVIKERSALFHKPSSGGFEEAAAIVFGGTTALFFLEKANLSQRKYPHVLVYGATGSVGSSAVQLAIAGGAKITAVCSAAGTELARSLGATTVIDYRQTQPKDLPGKYDIVFDAVGKLRKGECKKLLNPGGRFITVGGMNYAAETRAQLEQLKTLFEEGRLQPVIDRVYTLDEIREAHRYVDTERKKGNVVLRIG